MMSSIFIRLCLASEPIGPAASPYQFEKGGQSGWCHAPAEYPCGYFHTYDKFQVAGSSDMPRKVHIFLPRDYEKSANRYPVIYMNDGQTAFFVNESPVGKSWDAARVICDLYDQQAIRDVIVVAIFPIDRNREYTHEQVRDWAYGGLDEYARYLAEYVKPWIDANYRTQPDASNTMVLGSSHGGLAAFYTAALYRNIFGNAACLSSSFWVGLDSNTLVGKVWGAFYKLRNSSLIKKARPFLSYSDHPRIYIDWGKSKKGDIAMLWIEDNAAQRSGEMVKILTGDFGYKFDQDLFVVSDPEGQHDEYSWRRRLPNVLKIFFPK